MSFGRDFPLQRRVRLLHELSVPDNRLHFSMHSNRTTGAPVETRLSGLTRAGQHNPGTIAKAVIEALATADDGLRLSEICAQVEKAIGEPISRSSIKESLRRRLRKAEPEVTRSVNGRYRLSA
jgi:hypothetical protein